MSRLELVGMGRLGIPTEITWDGMLKEKEG